VFAFLSQLCQLDLFLLAGGLDALSAAQLSLYVLFVDELDVLLSSESLELLLLLLSLFLAFLLLHAQLGFSLSVEELVTLLLHDLVVLQNHVVDLLLSQHSFVLALLVFLFFTLVELFELLLSDCVFAVEFLPSLLLNHLVFKLSLSNLGLLSDTLLFAHLTLLNFLLVEVGLSLNILLCH